MALSGGASFLSEDLGDIVCYARGETGISGIQVISNGTRLTKEELEKIKPYVSGVPFPLMATARRSLPISATRAFFFGTGGCEAGI